MKLSAKLRLLALLSSGLSVQAAELPEMTVYHSPTCQCCSKWIEHAKQSGFKIKDIVTDEMSEIKSKLGLPQNLASCHTVEVAGYVVEGHVPADDVKKLLNDKPKVAGISAPGMPMGSPGMEMGGRKDHYQVVSFDKANNVQVFAEH